MTQVQVAQWTRSQRGLAWLSFGVFFIGFILYMVGYTGNYWYVSPVVNYRYPPDNPIDPINFGLFYLCFRGHCKYDLRQDYQIVMLLPPELGITWAYQNYRTACMAIVSVGAISSLLALGCYMLFLSGLGVISLIFGYITAGLQILSAILSLVGVIIFGWQFYGDLDVSPFGWSFGLTIVGIIFFLLNGVMLVLHTIFIHMYVSSARNRNRTQPTSCWGQLTNCLQGCLQGI